MVSRLFAIAAIGVSLYAQDAKPVIDNERVTVWDVTGSNPAGSTRDVVTMWLTGPKAGTASFTAKGHEPAKGAGRSLEIELKDFTVPPIENKTGYPLAFPRPHVKKLLENNRVIVWSYRWNPGEPTPMHFHDKDVVLVYLEDTALTSTTPDGKKTLNQYKAYEIRFNKRDRTHTELLDHGTGSAIMMELK